MSKYVVWRDFYSEGWQRSEDFETLEQCFKYLGTENYGSPYEITKTVDIEYKDLEDHSIYENIDKRPHSRACVFMAHPHGNTCSDNCPTCHGKEKL